MVKLNISGQGIKSLKEFFEQNPQIDVAEITILDCSLNNLEDLEGCPPNVKELWCNKNKLKSLSGCPQSVRKLYCHFNLLKTLEGCSQSAREVWCSHNRLTSVKGCPSSVQELHCFGNTNLPLEYYKPSFGDFNEICGDENDCDEEMLL